MQNIILHHFGRNFWCREDRSRAVFAVTDHLMLTNTYRPRKNGCSYIGFWMRGARRRPGPGGFFSPRTKTPKQYWIGIFSKWFGAMPVMLCSRPWHTDSHDHRYRIFWGLLKQIRFNMVCGLSVIGTREGNHCRNNGGNHGWNANIFFVLYEFLTRDFKQSKLVPVNGFCCCTGLILSGRSRRGLDKAIFCRELARGSWEETSPNRNVATRPVWRFRPETLPVIRLFFE